MTLLPLELRLKHLADSEASEFPNRSGGYFERYLTIKLALARRYYDVAGAGLALGGERYTRHDIGHVNDVILTAGRMLGEGSDAASPAFSQLAPYEVFVLLLAILLHDAGNAIGRLEHEKRAASILEELGAAVDLEQLEKKLVSSIARAHGGRTPSGGKDTIAAMISSERPNIGHIKVHARRLAAVLRLADELSENPRRADDAALVEGGGVPPESVVHNLFCKVVNIDFDYVGRSIRIDFNLNKALLAREFALKEDSGDEVILLVDYIRRRLEKCELERRYCYRFLAGFATYDRIRGTLAIQDGYDVIDEIGFELEDSGYPTEAPNWSKVAPRFDGAALRAEHCVAPVVERIP